MDKKTDLVQRRAPLLSSRSLKILQLSPEVRSVYEGLREAHDEIIANRYLAVISAPPAPKKDQAKAKRNQHETFLRRKREISRALGDDCLNMRQIAERLDMAPETTRKWLMALESAGVVTSSKPDNYIRYYRLTKNGQ